MFALEKDKVNLDDDKQSTRVDSMFIRILTSALMLFISSFVVVDFLFAKPRFTITTEIIFCFLILTLLCLYDKFDNFTIGKLFSMKKEVKKTNLENQRLKDEHFKLVNSLVSINSNNNQSHVYNMMASAWPDGHTSVDTAGNSEEIDVSNVAEAGDAINPVSAVDRENEEKTMADGRCESDEKTAKGRLTLTKYFRISEKLLIDQYVKNNNIQGKLEYQLRVFNNENFDDIVKRDIRFDAYINTGDENIFIETSAIEPFIFSDKLYSMLTFVKKYEEITKVKSKLVFLLPNYDKEFEDFYFDVRRRANIDERIKRRVKDIKEKYSPAIYNKLLEVEIIDISKHKLDQMLEEREKEV